MIQALCLFGLPQSVLRIYASRETVDDYIDILLYYSTFRVRLKQDFREAIPPFVVHGKKVLS
jgi:hypothetical protein